jgi:hypothetical protein
MRILFSLLLVCCAQTLTATQALTARNFHVHWEESRIVLGQKLCFTLLAEDFDIANILSVQLTKTNEDWEYVQSERLPNQVRVWVQCFALKHTLFPGLTIRYEQDGIPFTLETGPQHFYVHAPETDLSKEPPILGIRAPEAETSFWWAYVLAALFALLLGIFFWRRIRQKRGFTLPGAQEIADPWDLVKERIALLRRHLPEDEAGIKEHVFLINETLKQYLGARAGYSFLELTSSEVMREYSRLAWHGVLNADTRAAQLAILKAWLERGDMAKFARQVPDVHELTKYIDSFEAWVIGVEEEWRGYQDRLAEADPQAIGGGKA